MSLKDLMAEDLEEVFFNSDEFGEPAIYQGTETIVIPFIGQGSGKAALEYDRKETAFFSVMAAVVPDPQVDDILIHNGVEWRLDAVISLGRLRHKLRFLTN